MDEPVTPTHFLKPDAHCQWCIERERLGTSVRPFYRLQGQIGHVYGEANGAWEPCPREPVLVEPKTPAVPSEEDKKLAHAVQLQNFGVLNHKFSDDVIALAAFRSAARAEGKAVERKQIVEWLRQHPATAWEWLQVLAGQIERGDHER